MTVREGNSRQMATLDGELFAKVSDVSKETGLTVSKVLSAGAANLVDPRGSSRANENAKRISDLVAGGDRWEKRDA